MAKIKINKHTCKSCELCINVCPRGLIGLSESMNKGGMKYAVFIDKDKKCTGCTFCALMCPDMCIEVFR